MLFKIITLGCKVNAYESQAMALKLQKKGYLEANDDQVGDIYVIHTCAVTNTAAFKSRQKIRQAKKLNPKAIIVVVGCYVQTNASELNALDIDILIGSSGKSEIGEIVANFVTNRNKITRVDEVRSDIEFEESEAYIFEHQHRAYLKVQDGCNQFCSYCIIPFSRGNERSIEIDRAIEMAKNLVAQGHVEIVLAGIHTGRYGYNTPYNLYDLLKRLLNEVKPLRRLRLSSIEAMEISDDIINLIKDHDVMAKHLHIPLQSGSDQTLKRMNRHYDKMQYLTKLQTIRAKIPNISISSDVIVGFPDESVADFEETMAICKQCDFSFLHIFPFSARSGTLAQTMKNHHSTTIKKQRVNELMQLSNDSKKQYYASFINQELIVLVEEVKNNKLEGYSSEYIRVVFDGDETYCGSFVRVKIVSADADVCFGLIIE